MARVVSASAYKQLTTVLALQNAKESIKQLCLIPILPDRSTYGGSGDDPVASGWRRITLAKLRR